MIGLIVLITFSAATAAAPKGAPKAFKLGFVDFFSGGEALFGDKWNKDGGIGGVPVKLILVDERGGPAKAVTELRRLALDEEVDAVVGYTSSANCLAIGPVAEELQVLTVVHICGTCCPSSLTSKRSPAPMRTMPGVAILGPTLRTRFCS